MPKPTTQVQYEIRPATVTLIGILRSDRGSKYRGRSFVIDKEGKSKEELQREVFIAMGKLLSGSE